VRSSLTGLEDPKAKVFGEWGPQTFPRRHDQKKRFHVKPFLLIFLLKQNRWRKRFHVGLFSRGHFARENVSTVSIRATFHRWGCFLSQKLGF